MHTCRSHSPSRLDDHNLELVQDKLEQTLDMLDYYGVSGVVAACLLPAGATYVTSGGMCTDLTGATMALYAGITAIQDLAEKAGAAELATSLNEAAHALAQVALPVRDNRDTH